MKFAVMTGHQPQTTKRSMQALERIAGIEDLEGILKRIASPAIHRGIDLDIPPGEHQQRWAELIDCLEQHPPHVQHRKSSEIKDPLGHPRETFVEMVREVDRPDREDGIAGQPHKQHPFLLWRQR